MTASPLTAPPVMEAAALPAYDITADLRARALADVRTLRALARAARTDGLPQAALRAANATAAARSVLRHARRLAVVCPPAAGRLRLVDTEI